MVLKQKDMPKVRKVNEFSLTEKLGIFKRIGWTYNPITGEVCSTSGNPYTSKDPKGYINLATKFRQITIHIYAHQFAWYMFYDEVPNVIDHKDRVRHNNKIDNLRNGTAQQNRFNLDCKGYKWHAEGKKWVAQIMVNKQHIHLGMFEEEEDARNAYLAAKKIHHITSDR